MESAPVRAGRIVVINDDEDFLALMYELLTDVGDYEVVLRRDADRAYHFVKDQRPDLVILDIRMQGVDVGWSILESLTLDPDTASIPVIMCTAAIPEVMAQRPLLNRHGVDILTKPFDLDDLLEKVDAARSRHRPDPGNTQG
jgi:CheY-like chemotaxis protein